MRSYFTVAKNEIFGESFRFKYMLYLSSRVLCPCILFKFFSLSTKWELWEQLIHVIALRVKRVKHST